MKPTALPALLLALLPLAGCASSEKDTTVAYADTGAGTVDPLDADLYGWFPGMEMPDDASSSPAMDSGGGGRFVSATVKNYRRVYTTRSKATPRDDAQGQLDLANFARDNGLYAHARRHYDYAVAADPGLADQVDKERAELRRLASDSQLARGKAALEQRKFTEASKHLSSVVREFPEEPAAREAEALLAKIQAEASAERTRAVPSIGEDVEKALESPKKDYERAVKKNQQGLEASGKPSRALKLFDGAVSDGDRARRKLDKVATDSRRSEPVKTAARQFDDQVVTLMIDAKINQASIYMIRESFNAALGAVNSALALDGQSKEARYMRQRIENAAATSGYRW